MNYIVPLPSPPSKGSAIGRKITSKVFLLVDKFESLTKIHTSNEASEFEQPSYVAHTSAFRRIGTSVLKRATSYAEHKAGARSPKRDFLKTSRAKRQTAKNNNKNQHTHTNDDFGCDGSGSTADSNSPNGDTSSTPTDTDASSTSTPAEPILPSSFFRQLVQSGENTSKKIKKNTRKTTKRKKNSPMPSVNDLRNNVRSKPAAKDSRPESPAKDMPKKTRSREFGFAGFKRKSTPQNPSVKELRERFQKAERTQPVEEVPLRVLSREELKSRQEQKTVNGPQLGREAGSSSRIPSSNNGTAGSNNEERRSSTADYEEMERRGNTGSTSSYGDIPLVCRDGRYPSFRGTGSASSSEEFAPVARYPRRNMGSINPPGEVRLAHRENEHSSREITKSVSPPHWTLCGDDLKCLGNDFRYMYDGTLSNFGYLLYRLESVANSPRPRSEVSTTDESTYSYSMASTPLDPRRAKVYRKTPPPHEFFNPENRRIMDTSDMERRLDEDFPIEVCSEGLEIISPTPRNAVQAAEMRSMAFRHT